jgi:hypothetical protein
MKIEQAQSSPYTTNGYTIGSSELSIAVAKATPK